MVRAGRRRHTLPRRVRRAHPGRTGAAVANPPGRHVRAGRRRAAAARGRPDRGRDPPRPGGDGRRRRGSARTCGIAWPSSRSGCRPCATARPTSRRWRPTSPCRAAKRLGMPPMAPTAEDVSLLVSYPWPGNVRELAAVIDARRSSAAAVGSTWPGLGPSAGGHAGAGHPTPRIAAPRQGCGATRPPSTSPWPGTSRMALARSGGRIEGPSGAAALLEINPHTLRAGCASSASTGRASGPPRGGNGPDPSVRSRAEASTI